MNTKPYLYANACMFSVADLLHLMTVAEHTTTELEPLLRNHANAIAEISDEQISAFVKEQKEHAKREKGFVSHEKKSLLSALPIKLRLRRNNYAHKAHIQA